jgi:adenylate kinase
MISNPPKVVDICDTCGAGLIIRKDDDPETIRNRLQTYHAQTAPLKAYYEAQGKLKTVGGQSTVADTTKEVIKALNLG